MTFNLVEVILYVLAGVDELCIRTSHVYCPIIVKCDVRYMHTVLLNIHDFHENRCREDRTCLMDIKELICTLCSVKAYDIVIVKNAMVKSVLHHRLHHLHLMLNFVYKATKLISWHYGLYETFVFDNRSPLLN
jgi:hypothetical protein